MLANDDRAIAAEEDWTAPLQHLKEPVGVNEFARLIGPAAVTHQHPHDVASTHI